MEFITLLILNLAIGMGIYILVSQRVHRILQESYGGRLQEKIQKLYSLFIQESNLQLELLDNKIRGLRELLIRTDKALEEMREENATLSGLRLQLQNLINQSKELLGKQAVPQLETSIPPNHPISTRPYQPEPQPTPTPKNTLNPKPTPWIEGLGKTVKEIFLGKPQEPILPRAYETTQSGRILFSVEGNPLEEEDARIVDLNQEFLTTLRAPQNPNPDKLEISIDTLLAQLPPSATKIDKTVHLLKNGFSHEEIAKALDLGTREVSLIETIRMKDL